MTFSDPHDPQFLALVWRFLETSDPGAALEPDDWFPLAEYLAGMYGGLLASFYALAHGLAKEQAEQAALQFISEQRAMRESLAGTPPP